LGKPDGIELMTEDDLVTAAITFLFCYLYLLISGLDDPFDIFNGDTNVDLKPIDRFKQRLDSDFLVYQIVLSTGFIFLTGFRTC
jgi:hypothetical protein